MTKTELASELQIRQSLKYLTYLSLEQIMLDNYEDCRLLKVFNENLYQRHKKLIIGLKNNSEFAYKFIQKDDKDSEAIKQFHNFTNIFEVLHNAIDKGGNLFGDCLDAMDQVMIKQGLKEDGDK